MHTLAEHLAHCGRLVSAILSSLPLHCQTDTKERIKGCMAVSVLGEEAAPSFQVRSFYCRAPFTLVWGPLSQNILEKEEAPHLP